jgi:hypothetical protein
MGGNLMRTVTFADVSLVKKLNSQVHCVWSNQNPDSNVDEPIDEVEVVQAVPEGAAAAYPCGGGGGNIRAYFCTADGEVIHYVQGYWPAKNFAQELEFALKIFEATKSMEKEVRKQAVIKALQTSIESMEHQRTEMAKNNPYEFTKAITESALQREHAAIGLRANAYRDAINNCGRDMAEIQTEIALQNVQRGKII